jgi:hypothetical protein
MFKSTLVIPNNIVHGGVNLETRIWITFCMNLVIVISPCEEAKAHPGQ